VREKLTEACQVQVQLETSVSKLWN